MPRLSQSFVKSLGPVSRDTWHWDDVFKGFAVRQRPGIEPQWWVRYAINGKKRKHLIGTCAVVKADTAREEAREYLEAARKNKDRKDEVRTARNAPTIADLAKAHLELQKPPKISEAYYRDKKSAWERHIKPALGSIKVAELARSDVERFHSSYRKQPALANALLAILSKAIGDSLDFRPPWRSDNPCRRITKFTIQERQRILSRDELERTISYLEAEKIRLYNHPLWAAPWLFEFLLITGLRLREAANRRWKEIDLGAGTLTIPKPKAKKKARVVTLSRVAIELLEAIPKRGDYVFPNSTGEGPFKSPQKRWIAMRSEIGLDDVRAHDLRHTVASYAHHDGGVSHRELAELLGHSQMSTTERYINVHDETKRSISDRAAGAIKSSRAPEPRNV